MKKIRIFICFCFLLWHLDANDAPKSDDLLTEDIKLIKKLAVVGCVLGAIAPFIIPQKSDARTLTNSDKWGYACLLTLCGGFLGSIAAILVLEVRKKGLKASIIRSTIQPPLSKLKF
jgi:hypothetical protein